jgi:hypothetical protein
VALINRCITIAAQSGGLLIHVGGSLRLRAVTLSLIFIWSRESRYYFRRPESNCALRPAAYNTGKEENRQQLTENNT